MFTDHSRLDSAIAASTPTRTLPVLLAELVELGREAWRLSERERAVRAEIEALYAAEENYTLTGYFAA
jgi:hypothetical protein